MLFILSLILAFFIWLIHNLSLDYYSYLQFRVIVNSTIEGYEAQSVSQEPLVVHGKAPGLFFLKHGRWDGMPKDLELTLNPTAFHPTNDRDGLFYVRTTEIREALSELFGDELEIDFISNESLSFHFEKAICKKVEVILQNTISYAPQYMLVGEIELTPDSVMIYGKESDLANITSVRTSVVSKRMIDNSVNSFVNLEKIPGVRIDADRVQYSLTVQRYVEQTADVKVESINTPSNRNVIILPSTVKVTYRAPFKELGGKIQKSELGLVIDYETILGSNSGKIIPSLSQPDIDIFSYELDPPFVECILVEK